MINPATFPPNYFGNLFLVVVRVGSMIVAAPLLQGRAIPSTLKVGLAVLIAFLLVPLDSARLVPVPFDVLGLSAMVVKEMGVGLAIGYTTNLVFSALSLAGQYVGLQIGFTLANVIDPLFSQTVSILDEVYTAIASLVFLAIGGERMLILALQQTLDMIPLGSFQLTGGMVDEITVLTANVFVVAVRVALPIMATLLLADIGMGLIARSFPQMNIFVIGLPVKIFVGFFVLVATLPAVNSLAGQFFTGSFVDLSNLLRMKS